MSDTVPHTAQDTVLHDNVVTGEKDFIGVRALEDKSSYTVSDSHSYVMRFQDAEGQFAEITLKDGKVSYSGGIPIDDSAKLFFKHVLMAWRHQGRDEDYAKAKEHGVAQGYRHTDSLTHIIQDMADTVDTMRTLIETIRYEASQEDHERLNRIKGYTDRALEIMPS